jgi:hypothetical protein
VESRLCSHPPDILHHTPDDDDRSAVTFWIPNARSFTREDLACVFDRMAALARSLPDPDTSDPAWGISDPSPDYEHWKAEGQYLERLRQTPGIRPHAYVYDGTGPEECTFTELTGEKCGMTQEWHAVNPTEGFMS